MIILGLNLYHADSSACLLINGKIIAASEEERFTRIKHMAGFPSNSINFCLNKAKISINQVDLIAVNFNGKYNFIPKIAFTIKNIFNFNFIKNKIKKYFTMKDLLNFFYVNFGLTKKIKILNVSHHLAHAASAVLVSGLKNGLSISLDGSGDFSTGEVYVINENKFKLVEKNIFPHSIGLFYQSLTQYLGFNEYGDEYKVMGLAAYGKPIYISKLKDIISCKKGKIVINLKYFNNQILVNQSSFTKSEIGNLYSNNLIKFLGKPRKKGSKILKKHKDLAASIQKVFEEMVLKKIFYYQNFYKQKNLFLSGGCFFNSLANMTLIEKLNFKKVFIQPNAGDAGGALGAALIACEKYDVNFSNKKMRHLYLGFDNNKEDVKKIIKFYYLNNPNKFKIREIKNLKNIYKIIAKEISNSKIVAWHQGRAEFGPRALGNRSILADPRKLNIKKILNLKIKNRDNFRPFAPSVLDKYAKDYFLLSSKYEYNYMNCTSKVKQNKVSQIPAVINIDNTARIQIVSKKNNINYYNLINHFYKLTGVPMLLNTSLNIEEPISNTCEDSIQIFLKSKIDFLVIENFIISRIQ